MAGLANAWGLERETAGVAIDFGPARRLELKNNGAGNRVRTGDLNLGKVALYQLSYSRISLRVSTAVVAGTGEAGRPPTTMARLRSTN